MMHRAYIRPTVEEQRRITAMMSLGCVACAHLGIPNVKFTECHHIVEGSKRLGHLYTIPLCIGHHQGVWTREQDELIEPKNLVSLRNSRRRFIAVYPTERELWERVQERLRLPAIWPPSKILPRLEVVS